ncbi:MAG: Adenine specific DNA methylase Mod [Candidatus Beckwithbacteria bacterium GW2011_GWA1_46_30]|nr:MAG: Adenine specific DNA methylase Mod [Candidatus Beckwithbacteria bacterium GW2011_GWA1_46_30]
MIEKDLQKEIVALKSEIRRLKKNYLGLVFEDKPEDIMTQCRENVPVLKEVKARRIISDDQNPNNLLIEGDNYHSLSVLNYTHKKNIDLIYIDPPYNTGANNWKYNNDYVDKEDEYRHSKWLSLIRHRLNLAKNLLKDDGVLICAIDDNEQAHISVLIESIFSAHEQHAITIVHNPKGVQGKNFSYTHEYAIFVVPKDKKIIGDRSLTEEEIYVSNLRNWGNESERTDAKNCFYPIIISNNKIVGFGGVSPDNFHPKSANEKQKDGTVHVYPIDEKGIERKWRYARQSVEEIKDILQIKESRGDLVQIMIAKDYGTYKTVWTDKKYDASEYGTKLLRKIIPNCDFDFPKSLYTVYDCLFAVVGNRPQANILDFFAGSGTTGHAVLEMNKVDGGKRKFILCTNNENNNGNGTGGIAESVCYPRIKNVIKGYKDKKNEKVAGLGGNLFYYKTDLVNIEKIQKLGELIEKLEKKSTPVALYIFSWGKNEYKGEYSSVNIRVEDIPEPILEVYKEINRL